MSVVRLGEVVKTRPGNSKLIKGKLPSEIGPGLFPAFSASGQDVFTSFYEHTGDAVVISAVGARCGKCFLASGRWSAIANTHVLLPDQSKIDVRYLWYRVNDERFWTRGGSAQPFVRVKDSLHREIVLPDLKKQCEIVAELEKQFSRLDEAVANLKRVKANLRRQRATILRAAVEGTLLDDERRAEWVDATIGDVGQVISGLTKNPKREGLPRKLPYLRVANVYANELRLDQIEYIGVADQELDKLLLRQGDLLVVEGNGSPDQIGRAALWDGSIENCVHQNHLIKVRFGDRLTPQWALTWLLSPCGRHEIEQVSSSTSGLHTLSTGKVGRLPISVPPVSEQQRIVAEVDRRLSIVREVEAEVDANLKRAQALRQAVLAKAFGAGR
ncbi:MAG: restriction endonuclease subunit S [Chloroflexi bacterium]|nr:restriction endonuclease subunit S [Chloroflexota bacterium]